MIVYFIPFVCIFHNRLFLIKFNIFRLHLDFVIFTYPMRYFRYLRYLNYFYFWYDRDIWDVCHICVDRSVRTTPISRRIFGVTVNILSVSQQLLLSSGLDFNGYYTRTWTGPKVGSVIIGIPTFDTTNWFPYKSLYFVNWTWFKRLQYHLGPIESHLKTVCLCVRTFLCSLF